MANKVLILAEERQGKLKNVSRDAIGFGLKLAHQNRLDACVVILGENVANCALDISESYGVRVLAISDQSYRNYTPETYCFQLHHVIGEESPFLVLMGHSYQTVDYAPKLATMLGRGFIPNCIDCQIDAGRVILTRNIYGGKINQQLSPKGDPPYLVSLQNGIFWGNESVVIGQPNLVRMAAQVFDDLNLRRRVLETIAVDDTVDIGQAEVIVAGGRGLGSKENFEAILDLANVMGAAVGATRPVVDEGWVPRSRQIGSSGRSVAPRLYIACGISGAVQHLVGLRNAGCVVAINRDPQAPIFGVADYGIVGDVLTIVPALIHAVKEFKNVLP